jgi:hypothetical protein
VLFSEKRKGVIRSRKSKMDRKCNGQKNRDKRAKNDLQNTTQKQILNNFVCGGVIIVWDISWVPIMKQELPTLLEQVGSPPAF